MTESPPASARQSAAAQRFSRFIHEAQDSLTVLDERVPIPLTPGDIVGISEAWNKALAWKDSVFEAIPKRWGLLVPDLERACGKRWDVLGELLFGFVDLKVRALAPERENVARESYRAAHPDPKRECESDEEYERLFAELGFRPKWWVMFVEVFVWALETHVPYFEDVETVELEKGVWASSFGRFAAAHVARPAIDGALLLRNSLHAPVFLEGIPKLWTTLNTSDYDKMKLGQKFYKELFTNHPELINYFNNTDLDFLALHLMQTVEVVATNVDGFGEYDSPLRRVLEHLSDMHRRLLVPSWAHALVAVQMIDVLPFTPVLNFSAEELAEAFTALLRLVMTFVRYDMLKQERLLEEAREWFELYAKEKEWSPERLSERLLQVDMEVNATGTYTLMSDELEHGARVAWRNSTKCVGRISWNTLIVRDKRHVNEPEQICSEIIEHLKLATGGTNLQSVMTVFAKKHPDENWGPRFWSSQFVRYACYRKPDGSLLGDPANLEFTDMLIRKNLYTPPETRGAFDVLPVVFKLPDLDEPYAYDMPSEFVHECTISHPRYPKVAELGLRWASIPVIANFNMRIGGLDFVACPFNGWFADVEVVRNLVERYDVTDVVADACGIDKDEVLYQNRVYHELTVAVISSFEKHKMTMVDQRTVGESFIVHCNREREKGRECPAQWSWIGGLLGPNNRSVWGHEMRDFVINPQYMYLSEQWRVLEEPKDNSAVSSSTLESDSPPSPTSARPEHEEQLENLRKSGRPNVLILFGSETGTVRLGEHNDT